MSNARNIADIFSDANTANEFVKLDGSSRLPALDGSNLTGVAETKPVISSISPDTIDNTQTSVTITGTDFVSVPIVQAISSTGGITLADTVTFTNSTTIVAAFTLPTDGTYYLRIENPNGLAVRSSTALLTVSDSPTFSTSAGSLGDVEFGDTGSFTVSASSDSTITYSKVSGDFPSGFTLNASTGVISGTENSGGSSDTTYNFTIRATDTESQTTDRAFSISAVLGNYFGDGSDGSLST